eukprot:10406007-Lingulodinium_polyedra.AAC.1
MAAGKSNLGHARNACRISSSVGPSTDGWPARGAMSLAAYRFRGWINTTCKARARPDGRAQRLSQKWQWHVAVLMRAASGTGAAPGAGSGQPNSNSRVHVQTRRPSG